MYQTTTYASPVGELTLASDGTALTGLWLEGQKYFGGTSGEELAPGRPDLPGRSPARRSCPWPRRALPSSGRCGRSSRTSPTGR